MSPHQLLSSWRRSAPLVFPSLLLCDFARLEVEVRKLEAAGISALHLDVMDGRFVPNLTYGMPIVSALRRTTSLALDVHLMIEDPQDYVPQFVEAGADLITVHVEATAEPGETLRQIRQLGVAAGLALNPKTPLQRIEPFLEDCDLVLVMSVPAGFGGQSFDPVALDKLTSLRQRTGSEFLLQVDGGVNASTVARCVEAGAHTLVAGSAIFGRDDYAAAVEELLELARGI